VLSFRSPTILVGGLAFGSAAACRQAWHSPVFRLALPLHGGARPCSSPMIGAGLPIMVAERFRRRG
jgi:hypothetical protein